MEISKPLTSVANPRRVEAEFIQEEAVPTRKRKYRKFRFIFLGVFLAMIATIAIFVVNILNDLPPMTVIENPHTDLSTQIYSSDGKLMRSLYSEEHRISVKLNEISPNVLNALIATEDSRFYSHSGIDAQAIPAVAKDVLTGKGVRGMSTITMQLARNLYDQIGRERNIWRKLKEMVVAIILEKNFTKEEIIAAYLNTVSFVGNTFGIQNGARSYFGKDAIDLNVEEAAMLVGILKGTGRYDPRRHPQRATTRRNTVINKMVEHEMLEKTEADSIKKLPLGIGVKANVFDLGSAAYFTEHLRIWLKDWCAQNGYDLYTDGLKVYTTIDSRMQAYAENAVNTHLRELQPIFDKHIAGREAWVKDSTILWRAMRQSYRYLAQKREGKTEDEIIETFHTPIQMQVFKWADLKDTVNTYLTVDTLMSPWDSLKYYSRFLETGTMAIDPSNGHIKSWVGGINHLFFKYDHVFKGKRQVGSTFKPFVYTAAFDNGSTPCDKELNQPVFFYNEREELIWNPKNSDGKIGGYMTLRRGLATSTNLITARVMKKIGPRVVCEWARKMGISSQLDCVPSLALGTTDLSVFELTGAYCTFANRGVFNEPIFVTRIEDQNGNIIADFQGESREAISEETAYMMLNMLQGVVNEPGGTAGRLRLQKYGRFGEVGGKTGTTQNQSDGWFMGVTPYLVSGTWVGCSDRSMRFRSLKYGQGASLALPIFGNFMRDVYADSTIAMPKDRFQEPKGFDIELNCDVYDLKKKPSIFRDSTFMGTKSIMNVDDDY